MTYTEQEKEQFRIEFAKRRRRQLIATAPAVLAVIVVGAAGEGGSGELFGLSQGFWLPVVVAVIGAVLLFSFRNWRCPACDRYLGRSFNPKFCSKCGAELR